MNDDLRVGDEVVDEGGQNGVGIITEIGFGDVEADWTSHRFDGVVRGRIGKRWIRRTATAEEVAARKKS